MLQIKIILLSLNNRNFIKMKQNNNRLNIKLNETKKHEKNPFIVELKDKMYLQPRANSIIAKGQSIVDTDTGEIVQDSVLIGRRKYVDKSQFAKVYASEIGVLYELSKSAQNVFLYLTKVMDYENKAFFNYNTDYKKIGYKGFNTPYLGLKELISRNIIASSHMPHFYWLNPTIVCKGERFAKYTEYVVAKNDPVEPKAIMAKQIKKQIERMPEEVEKKLNYTSDKTLFDDKGYDPYQDPNQTNLLDQIDDK